MNYLYNKIKKISKPKWIVIFFILFIISYTLINGSIIGVAKLKQISGGTGILDMQLFYSAEDAYQLFNDLSEEGRAFYKNFIALQDFVFPVLYTFFFTTLNTFFLSKLFSSSKTIKTLSLLPILGGLCDYIENILILFMISLFPKELIIVANISSIFTFVKFIIFIYNIALVLIASIMLFIRFKRKKTI